MITDAKLTFLDGVDVSDSAGTANVGDVIDLDVTGRELFGEPTIKVAISVGETFTSGGSATVSFKLVSDGSATPATGGAETLHLQTETYAFDDLVAGTQIVLPIPGGLPNAERYLGLQVVTAAATTTAGTISAALVVNAQNWKAYPDAVN